MSQVGLGSDKLMEYEMAADKYSSEIKRPRDWYVEDPIDCGRTFKTDKAASMKLDGRAVHQASVLEAN